MKGPGFAVVGALLEKATIARGRGVRERVRLLRKYGGARWRKMKAFGKVLLDDGTTRTAEVHWYEAHGVGAREAKIKRFL